MSRFFIARTVSQIRRQLVRDRLRRRRVASAQSWRGCIGLALVLDRPDDTFYHGPLGLVTNAQLRWMALYDLAAAEPGRDLCDCRNAVIGGGAGRLFGATPVVELSNMNDALQHAGLPADALDHPERTARLQVESPPGSPHAAPSPLSLARQPAAVAVAMSSCMTSFAMGAMTSRGWSYRPAWVRARPHNSLLFQQPAIPSALPHPYLAVSEATVVSAIDQIEQAGLTHPTLRLRFAADLAAGFLIRATEPVVYEGSAEQPGTGSHTTGGTPHLLRSNIDGVQRVVMLPRNARVTLRPGTSLAGGDVWAHAWQRGMPPYSAAVALAGEALPHAMMLRRLWLDQQFFRIAERPADRMVSAEIAAAILQLNPASLWWDTAPVMPFYDWQCQTAILPPIPQRRPRDLRLELPGGTHLNASRLATLPSLTEAA